MAVDLDDGSRPEGEPSPSKVVLSLASEVYWALLAATEAQARERHPELAELYVADPALCERVASFWDDGSAHYDELVVLAHFGGVLAGEPPLPAFLDAVRGAAGSVPADLRLGSESPSNRARLLVRLAHLRRDRALGNRYAQLLEDVWSPLDGTWRDELPAQAAASARLDGLLAAGTPWLDLLPPDCNLFHFDQLREGPGRAMVATTPGLLAISRFAAKLSVVDVTDVLFVSFAPPGLAVAERERAALLGRQVRAVADPTRLALLRLLAGGGRRVGELSAELTVSQPTVSNHLKVLKESGLVRTERRDGRQQLVVDRGALDRVLAEVAEFVAPPPACC